MDIGEETSYILLKKKLVASVWLIWL